VPRIVPPGQPWPEERRLQKGGRGPRRATNSFDCLRATTSAHGYTFRTRVSATARFCGEDSGYGQYKVGSSWGLDHTAGGRSVAIRVFRPKASRGRPHQAGEPASHRGGAELQEFHVARRGDVALHGPPGDVDHGTCGWREIADIAGGEVSQMKMSLALPASESRSAQTLSQVGEIRADHTATPYLTAQPGGVVRIRNREPGERVRIH
jgi:hypothetical protein